MKETITKKQLREFGLLIGLAFPILIGWILPATAGHGFKIWTLWVGLPGLILGLTAPRLLFLPYKGWMALGYALGWVNSHLILGLVFVVVLQPTAYIMRFFGYDPLRKRRKNSKTYREVRSNKHIDITRIF